jgi:hypothetical protein
MKQIYIHVALTGDEQRALERFMETCEDGQDYDVPKEMMRQLARIGIVRRVTRNIYEMTTLGEAVVAAPTFTRVY